MFVGATLMMAGLRVTVTRSFRRARALLLADPPSVLVTDVRPRLTKGLDLARLGRSLRPGMTQIVTSDRPDAECLRQIDAVGAAFVLAPMTEDRLLGALYRTALREPNADGSLIPMRPSRARGPVCGKPFPVPVSSSLM